MAKNNLSHIEFKIIFSEQILPNKSATSFLLHSTNILLHSTNIYDSLKYIPFMTLEPVHMHKISEFAKRIDRSFEFKDPKTATDIYNLL